MLAYCSQYINKFISMIKKNFNYKNVLFKEKGFTLIELLVFIAIILILALVILMALNPVARSEESRNSQRWLNVNRIINAIKLNQVDNAGSYLSNINDLSYNSPHLIGVAKSCNITCMGGSVVLESDCVDLSDLVDHGYILNIPFDPSIKELGCTGYYLVKHKGGAITVGACGVEKGLNDIIPEMKITR